MHLYTVGGYPIIKRHKEQSYLQAGTGGKDTGVISRLNVVGVDRMLGYALRIQIRPYRRRRRDSRCFGNQAGVCSISKGLNGIPCWNMGKKGRKRKAYHPIGSAGFLGRFWECCVSWLVSLPVLFWFSAQNHPLLTGGWGGRCSWTKKGHELNHHSGSSLWNLLHFYLFFLLDLKKNAFIPLLYSDTCFVTLHA